MAISCCFYKPPPARYRKKKLKLYRMGSGAHVTEIKAQDETLQTHYISFLWYAYLWNINDLKFLCGPLLTAKLLRKLDFAKSGDLEKKHFVQNIAFVQKTHFSQFLRYSLFLMLVPFKPIYVPKNCREKTVLENMGYWQNGSEIEKRYVA